MIGAAQERTGATGTKSDGSALRLTVTGMDCASCAQTIQRSVETLGEVQACRVSFAASALEATLAPDADPAAAEARVVRAVRAAGYDAEPTASPRTAVAGTDTHGSRVAAWWALLRANRRLSAALISGAFILLAWGLTWLEGAGGLPRIALIPSLLSLLGLPMERVSLLPLLAYASAVVLGGRHIARSGIAALTRARTFDINLLMTVAVLGAVSINEWAEAAAVVFLFSLGEGLESLTADRARSSIRGLMELSPEVATVRREGVPQQVHVSEVRTQEVMLVRPGDRLALDGRVLTGASTVNQASITGESVPVPKSAGDDIYAGTLNERGYMEVEVTREAGDTTLARIGRLVAQAEAQKAPAERFVDRFARYYTPAVLLGAIALMTLPPLLGQPFLPWFYRSLVLLVVSCPCALVISTPVAIVAALGNASRHGALIKGAAYLEQAGSLRVVAFDKTGTLTEGWPDVVEVRTLHGYEPEELVALAAVIEERSEHPLAAAILRRRQHELEAGRCEAHGDHLHDHDDGHLHLYPHDDSESHLGALEISDFEALAGRGARASLDGRTYYVGSPQLFTELGVDVGPLNETIQAWQAEGKTAMLVGTDTELFGAIAIVDAERPGARDAITELRQSGIERVVMLTGDNPVTAASVARRLGIDEYRAGLLPEDKLTAVRELLQEHGRVAMVGDGINDAPALAAATIGIAMGAAGSDTALETADIALMSDDLSKVAFVTGLSRRALGIIRANIAFALLVKAAVIGLTFAGVTSLWLAILADTGASLLVIANGMRLLRHGRTRSLL